MKRTRQTTKGLSRAERAATLDSFVLESHDHQLAPDWLDSPKLANATPEQVTAILQNTKTSRGPLHRAEGPLAAVCSFPPRGLKHQARKGAQ